MGVRMLTFNELKDHGVLLGRRQLDRLEAQGKFPKRVHVSEKRVAWVETEIDAYVRKQIAARPAA